MPLLSLGYRTDAMLRSFLGTVTEQEHYTVIRTTSNPTFRWGNMLVYPTAPQPGDLERWLSDFRREFPTAEHRLFGWDDPQGQLGAAAELSAAGFSVDVFAVLAAQTVHKPPKWNTTATFRPLFSDDDWQANVELSLAVNAVEPSERREGEGYADYLRQRNDERRAMVQAGWGQWWGAFVDGELAASLGVFARAGLGRFQDVSTHPQYRRRGLCGSLVYHAAQTAFDHGTTSLVMVADPADVAIGIYQSLGFITTQWQAAAEQRKA
jgi:ribosomal protein S18 acetylase RimI-like enzyme